MDLSDYKGRTPVEAADVTRVRGLTDPWSRGAPVHITGSAVIVQSRWGIRPYTAFLGALKLRDEVEVEFDVDLTPGS